MRADHLLKILSEYRPSMKLVMMLNSEQRFEMPLAEMISNLMRVPPSEHVALFGETFFILRERVKMPDEISPPYKREWLELDVRLST